jgi:hypothetical protein
MGNDMGNDMGNNMRNDQNSDTAGGIISWLVPLILLFTLWPIGIIMLIKKLSGSADGAQTRTGRPAARSADPVIVQEPKKSEKKKRNALEKKSGRFLATILTLISIALFILGANMMISAAGSIWDGVAGRLPNFLIGAFYCIGGLITFSCRNIGVNKINRYKKYYAFVDERGIVPIADIARSTGMRERSVRRDLQAMINSGYFGPYAYIDNELDCLVLFAEAAMEARRVMDEAREEPAARPTVAAPANQYMAIITELRDLNNTIKDLAISDKIDRIEALTGKIFRIVEDDPSKLPQIRRFMNYYLPTTLKLLHSYALLEKQDIKGENITSAKENISRILDTLATGYEQQLDQLFRSDVIDIAADINVLENMMQQDGLTGEKSPLQVMEIGG